MVAPQIEPKFSEWQASVKGGSCARNISGAFEHLGGFDEPVHGPRGTLWCGVLGEAAGCGGRGGRLRARRGGWPPDVPFSGPG